MRGVLWSPGSGLRCADCGGYEIDLQADGTARCRTCERVSVPRSPGRFAGIAHLGFALLGVFLVIVAAEAVGSFLYTAGASTPFLRTFSLCLLVTGFAAVIVAGIGATPGRVAFGNQRLDRMSVFYPVQDPVVMGTLTPAGASRSTAEPGLGGVIAMFAFGIVLIAVGYVLSLA